MSWLDRLLGKKKPKHEKDNGMDTGAEPQDEPGGDDYHEPDDDGMKTAPEA